MSNTTETAPTLVRRRRPAVKRELSNLVATTAKESSTTIQFALKATSNIMEMLHIETKSLVRGSKLDSIQDELETKLEAIESLSTYGISTEEINKMKADAVSAFQTKIKEEVA